MVDTHLIFVSGKGGTGKSAVAAGLAIARARMGETVLAMDMAASPGLARHLGVASLAYEPREIRDGLFAMAVDRAAALDEYLKIQLHIPQGAPTKQMASALSVLAETAPGVREIISIGKPVFEMRKGKWDTVIVDAPSLGQFQSYLRAPRTISELVPAGNVMKQAHMLETTISDPDRTTIILVSNPAELPINETSETLAVFASEGLVSNPQIVMNRVLPGAGIDAGHLDDIPIGPLRDAALLQTELEAEQMLWIDQLDSRWTLPYLRGVLTPSEVARQLSDAMAKST
ncbi:MAG: ArsA family ATPase [Acidimicrobiia bacterium]